MVREPSATIDQLARAYFALCSWEFSREDDIQNTGRGLVRALGSIVADLPPGGELIIQPDGDMAHIPWSSLPISDGAILVDRVVPVVWPLPLGRSQNRTGPPASVRMLVVGADYLSPVRAHDLRPIPALDAELAAAASLMPESRVLRGQDATAFNIEHYLAKASVLHFAGHAFSSPDGVSLITAPDPSMHGENSDVWHPSHNLCSGLTLAVFSACSTAKYEEIDTIAPQNLANEFLLAGTSQVVAARWNVDSKVTTDFMEEFYRGLHSGASTAYALQKAELSIRSRPGSHHPFFWAAFTFFGR